MPQRDAIKSIPQGENSLPYAPIRVNPSDLDVATRYASKRPVMTFYDVAVGMMVRKADKQGLLETAWQTWMSTASGMAILLLADCTCPRTSCRNLNVTQPLPAWLGGATADISVVCYYSYQRYIANANSPKAQAVWDELLKLPPRKYYVKIDTDTLLEPSLLLRFINVVHQEVRPTLPQPSLVYFGTDEYTASVSARHWAQQAWYANLSEAIAAEIGKPSTTLQSHPRTGRLNYAQGGVEGVSRHLLQLLGKTQCVRRVGEAAPANVYPPPAVEDTSLGICAHFFRAPLISSPCFHAWNACGCGTPNGTARKLNCRENSTHTQRCVIGSISMHKLKRSEWYSSCWDWQQEELLPLRRTLLRPYSRGYVGALTGAGDGRRGRGADHIHP
mmetsp:Transcript_53681/g.117077  ORF Transcript_53681/g.117077 Transcript_53681/m.117077 type:complete len:388 (-) Transcript_53681:302-1465(-)